MGVNPCLTYRDVRVALEWLENAFGIHGQGLAPEDACDEAPLDHALLTVDDATILVESERPEELHGTHAGHGWIYVTIADVDAHCRQARAAGAQILSEPHNFGEDHRGYSAADHEGNTWTFGTADPERAGSNRGRRTEA